MSDCDVMKESMPLLLNESLDPAQRELTHQHIERCPACSDEWAGFREAWIALGTLPELEPPPALKTRFLASIGENVEPFVARPAKSRRYVRWMAEAAAVVFVAGASYYAGHRSIPVELKPQPATLNSFSIAESRVLPAASVSPDIEGRPNIENISFIDNNPNDSEIGVSFDITSRVTVTGRPTDKTMVRLMRYVLENEDRMSPSRTRAIDWIRSTYSLPGNADPEIARAVANVLRNDTHEGVRMKAVETLTNLGPAISSDSREALIQALKTDPNPAVRIKAVEALANLLKKGGQADAATLETLRQKASQDDENVYVRVKAAEALSNARP